MIEEKGRLLATVAWLSPKVRQKNGRRKKKLDIDGYRSTTEDPDIAFDFTKPTTPD